MLKKICLLFIIVSICGSELLAQIGGVHNYLDTSYIAPRKMEEQIDFLKNKSNYPVKPRDMWQLGFFAGLPYINGACPWTTRGASTDLGSYAIGMGAYIRKALGYAFSIRGSFAYYNMLGLDYRPNFTFANNPKIQQLYGNAPDGYVANYRSMAFVPSLEGIVSFNNIMFHKSHQRWNIYGVLGISGIFYDTKMDLTNGLGNRYLVENVLNNYHTKSEILSKLRLMFNGGYETHATQGPGPSLNSQWSITPSISMGLGAEYRIGPKWSLIFEYKQYLTNDDYMDGWSKQVIVPGLYTNRVHNDQVGFFSIGTGINLGDETKRVAPLWWLNPLEFAYRELNAPQRMVMPKIKLDDADGDGVPDQFDLEPNTPKGCPVDSHGVSRDTDGDGVPDCRDKELLTPQKCFPVNADGVGTCPEPACCKEIMDGIKRGDSAYMNLWGGANKVNTCNIGELPSIQFKPNTVHVTKEIEITLNAIAQKIKSSPSCNIKVIGFAFANKSSQQTSWDRVNNVIRYLVEKQGIAESRFIFEYGQQGDSNTINLQATTENGPNVVPAPHPQLRRIN
jgi:hypothetical protein